MSQVSAEAATVEAAATAKLATTFVRKVDMFGSLVAMVNGLFGKDLLV
jgi:hypothetical protein